MRPTRLDMKARRQFEALQQAARPVGTLHATTASNAPTALLQNRETTKSARTANGCRPAGGKDAKQRGLQQRFHRHSVRSSMRLRQLARPRRRGDAPRLLSLSGVFVMASVSAIIACSVAPNPGFSGDSSMVIIRRLVAAPQKRPFYNIVATDSRNRRDGRFIERVGFCNPVATKGEALRIAQDRLTYWQGVGAQLSPTVRASRERSAKRRSRLLNGSSACVSSSVWPAARATRVSSPMRKMFCRNRRRSSQQGSIRGPVMSERDSGSSGRVKPAESGYTGR